MLGMLVHHEVATKILHRELESKRLFLLPLLKAEEVLNQGPTLKIYSLLMSLWSEDSSLTGSTATV